MKTRSPAPKPVPVTLKVHESDPGLRVYVGRKYPQAIGINGQVTGTKKAAVLEVTVGNQTQTVKLVPGQTRFEVAGKVASLHFDGFESSWAHTGRTRDPHYISFRPISR